MRDKIVNKQQLPAPTKLLITGRYFYGERAIALAAEYGIHPNTVLKIYNRNTCALSSAKKAAETFYSDRVEGNQSLHLCKFVMKS